MRQILTLGLILFSVLTFGQEEDKFSITFHLQPELTFYKNNYAYRWEDTYTKSTYNIGIGASVQFDLTKRFFSEAGLRYISRQLKTTAFLNQSVLPPPHQSLTLELVNTQSVSFRILEFPLNLGYRFITKEKMNLYINTGFTGNFLLNTYYGVDGHIKYQGAYKKNYWQGYSVNIGIGVDYKVSKKISATSRIADSVINTVKADEYLFSQDQYEIPLPYKFLSLTLGVKMSL